MEKLNNETLAVIKACEESAPSERPLTLLEWIGSLFLLCIPGLNIVAAIVFLFERKKSKTRANFILAEGIIVLAVAMIFGLLYCVLGSTLIDEIVRIWHTIRA